MRCSKGPAIDKLSPYGGTKAANPRSCACRPDDRRGGDISQVDAAERHRLRLPRPKLERATKERWLPKARRKRTTGCRMRSAPQPVWCPTRSIEASPTPATIRCAWRDHLCAAHRAPPRALCWFAGGQASTLTTGTKLRWKSTGRLASLGSADDLEWNLCVVYYKESCAIGTPRIRGLSQ